MPFDNRGPFWFAEVPADEVREPVRLAAADMLAHVRRHLRLPGLAIRWFRLKEGWPPEEICTGGDWDLIWLQREDGTCRGLRGRFAPVSPGVIWVRATLSPFATALVIAHEARHAWQHLRWKLPPTATWREHERQMRHLERDALEYEVKKINVASALAKKYKPEKEKREMRRDYGEEYLQQP